MKELIKRIEQLGITVIENPLVSIYIPSRDGIPELGIDFVKFKDASTDRNHYRDKYMFCHNEGLRLLTVFENEFSLKPELVISKIRNIVGKSERGVGARKLSIRPITVSMANAFFDQYHLQGRTGSIITAYGAYLPNTTRLVAAIAFNQQRNTQDIELIRYATDGATYAGIFTRLFRHALREKPYDTVLSFADLRYSQGDVYERNGFKLVKEIPADYRYIVGNALHHKSLYTKANIAKKFGLDMSTLTERQAMEQLKIPRIYDCGKLKYVWTR